MRRFRITTAIALALPLAFAALPAASEEAYVKIVSPADGAKLDRTKPVKLAYEANPGPKGDHVHIYIDGKEVGIDRQLKGTFTLDHPAPGEHTLCVKLADKVYVPIGVGQCIKVRVD